MAIHSARNADVESLALLQSLRAGAPFAFGVLDLDRRFIRVNDAFAAMNGVPADEHPGRSVRDVVPELWPQVEPALAHVLETREGTVHEVVGQTHGIPGRVGHWLSTLYPVHDGEELVAIGFLVQDVTEHRQAMESRSVIMQTIVEGLLVLDHEGRLVCMNESAAQMLGWSEDELRGHHVHEFIQHFPPDGKPVAASDRPVLNVSTQRTAVRSREDAFLRRDGRVLPVLCSSTPEPGGGVVIVFRDATEEIERRRSAERELEEITWVGRIREALDEGRLELYSQPIVPLTGGAAREEFLLRMITHDGEVVSAGAFLPAAERYGLIVDLDRWVITKAVRYAALGRIVQVNLSTASTTDPRVLDFIEHELRAAGAPAANVIFEVTETALMNNAVGGQAFAEGLRHLGCGLALDDFGSGFGSFTYLKQLPVQALKIDLDFVRDLPGNEANQLLVQAIVSLARSFGNVTIAEGVEDKATLDLLREYGVDFVQGYFIGRPASVARNDEHGSGDARHHAAR